MLTAQIEKLAECLDEMKPLFEEHWKELAILQDKMPLRPQYGIYLQREAMGEFILPTVRKDSVIVGYWPTFIAPGLHYGETLTATMDILWVKPEERGTGAGKLLYDSTEIELRRRGVKFWSAGSKDHKEIEWFLKMMGFEPYERHFFKWLGG